MRFSKRNILVGLLSVLLCGDTAATEITHYWAMRIRGGAFVGEYGLIGYREGSGATDTEVHFGSGYVDIPLHIYTVAVLANILFACPAAVVWFYARRGRRKAA
jgi:hypothetical protein